MEQVAVPETIQQSETPLPSSPTLETRHGVVVEIPVDLELPQEMDFKTPEARAAAVMANSETRRPRKRQKRNRQKSKGKDFSGFQTWSIPANWRTEKKLRVNGSTAGMTDTYYYHPESCRRFRSKREVFNFLSGIDPKRRGKTKDSIENNVPLENSDLKNEGIEAQAAPFGIKSASPPKDGKSVLTNSAVVSWSPFLSDEMVPEYVKTAWKGAFASVDKENGGR